MGTTANTASSASRENTHSSRVPLLCVLFVPGPRYQPEFVWLRPARRQLGRLSFAIR